MNLLFELLSFSLNESQLSNNSFYLLVRLGPNSHSFPTQIGQLVFFVIILKDNSEVLQSGPIEPPYSLLLLSLFHSNQIPQFSQGSYLLAKNAMQIVCFPHSEKFMFTI